MKPFWFPQSLTARVFALYTVTLLVFVGAGLGLFFKHEYASEIEDAHESATMLVELAAQAITESAVIGDYDTIKRTLDKSILRSQFEAAVFIDMKGTTLRSTNSATVSGAPPAWLSERIAGQLSDVNRSISAGGTDYGVLRLSFASYRVAASVWDFFKVTCGVALAAMLGGLGLIWFPLRAWLETLDRARQFEVDVGGGPQEASLVRIDDLPLEFRGPFEVLERTTNSLRKELEARKQAVASLRSAVSGLRPASAPGMEVEGDDIAALSETLAELVAAREAGRKRVHDHNAQLNAIFALSPDGFLLFDGQQNIRFVNTAFLRMTGTIAEEWLGLDATGFSERISRMCSPTSKFHGLKALYERQVQQNAGGLHERDEGENQRVVCELAPPINRVLAFRLRLSAGEDVSQILYCRDITQETEVDRMKSEFLSHAAHELRTPMASILGYSEVILAMEFPEEQRRELLLTIHRQSELLVTIINELLDLARIEARRGADFVAERLEVHELTAAVAAGWAPPSGRAPPVIVGDPAQIWLKGDRTKLMQAIGNVISNAYKYSPSGGAVEIRFDLAGEGAERHVTIAVTDHGIGMAEADLGRLGERFFRVDKSGKIPGTGLGVAIVKEIIELHGGHVTYDSAPGKGTTVTICLPSVGAEANT